MAPGWRGLGLSRRLMAELEARAGAAGLRRLVLECGTEQPEAMGLYLGLGFVPIPPYGDHATSVRSRCFAKSLQAEAGGAPAPVGCASLVAVDPAEDAHALEVQRVFVRP